MTTRCALFALALAGIAIGNWGTVRALFEHSQRDNTASHIVLIPFVSFFLIWLQRRHIFEKLTWSWSAGAVVCGFGVLLHAWSGTAPAVPSTAVTLRGFAIVLYTVAAFVSCFGVAAARSALFPLAFLVLVTPFPPLVLQEASDFLKNGSTETVQLLFDATGTPHVRYGYVFQLPYVAIEVADACSGIRSSIGLMITSLLAGHLFLRRAWSRVALVAVVIPITIFKNAVRIVTLTLLSIHVDRSFLTGQLHHEGGIVFFVISLALLAPVLIVLARSERQANTTPRHAGDAPSVSTTLAGHVQ
jgi:exosortase